MDFPTAHILLRDRRDWLGEHNGLKIDRDGDLFLARVPGPSNSKAVNVSVTYPYLREVSGLALGPCDGVFVAETAHDRVLFVDGLCKSQAWLDAPAHLRSPRGLALTNYTLLIADSGNARVQSLALPRLEANMQWNWWEQPTSIAVDSKQRLLVVDAATSTVNRMLSGGGIDEAFEATIASQGKLQKPLFVACGAGDRVLVSDSQANSVFVFASDGIFAFEITGPAGWQPGALVALDSRVYVADAVTGAIWVFEDDGLAAQFIGEVDGWRGPVTALAIGARGDLFIKPGLDDTYYRFAADAAYIKNGKLTAGPFDAGEEREWERACVDAQLPQGTSLTVNVALKDTTAPPATTDWIELPPPLP